MWRSIVRHVPLLSTSTCQTDPEAVMVCYVMAVMVLLEVYGPQGFGYSYVYFWWRPGPLTGIGSLSQSPRVPNFVFSSVFIFSFRFIFLLNSNLV